MIIAKTQCCNKLLDKFFVRFMPSINHFKVATVSWSKAGKVKQCVGEPTISIFL